MNKASNDRVRELISITADNDYWQAEPRNDDLSLLAEAVCITNKSLLGTQGAATVTKEVIVCAYLLGRRDAIKVPDVFTQD